MADTVTTQTYDGERNVTVILNNLSDGTGETLVKKLDVTTLHPNPAAHIKLWRAFHDVTDGEVILYWEGTPNRLLATLSSASPDLDFSRTGGLIDDATSGTGNVLLSTVGFVQNSSYTIRLEFKKGGTLVPGT